MKILITGHKGFVGKHFLKKLSLNPKNEVLGVDIKDGYDCRDFFKYCTTRFDLVVHLAAIVGGRVTIENDPLAVATDLSVDSEMFNWCVRTKQKRVIYYSSSAAYPISLQTWEKKHKLKETDLNLLDIKNPDNTYGWSKLSGEVLADYAIKQYGLKVHVFRPFSGYGLDQELSYPFPSFINRIKNKVEKFEIWGNGEQVRDFIHIDEVVEASLLIADLDITEPFNLGWGRPITFNELASLCFKHSKFTPKYGISHRLDMPVGVQYRCSDNSKLLQYYTPKISIEEILEKAF